jgi:putative transposase
MIEDALLTVVQEAYVQGISTRKMEKLFKAFGLPGIDKSKVSRICKELNEMVHQFSRTAITRLLSVHLAGCHSVEGQRESSGG